MNNPLYIHGEGYELPSDNKVFTQLLKMRRDNIAKISHWSEEDVKEMIGTYSKAKVIAEENNNFEAITILNEKISQLLEALLLKSR